jgi:hypothetical protein
MTTRRLRCSRWGHPGRSSSRPGLAAIAREHATRLTAGGTSTGREWPPETQDQLIDLWIVEGIEAGSRTSDLRGGYLSRPREPLSTMAGLLTAPPAHVEDTPTGPCTSERPIRTTSTTTPIPTPHQTDASGCGRSSRPKPTASRSTSSSGRPTVPPRSLSRPTAPGASTSVPAGRSPMRHGHPRAPGPNSARNRTGEHQPVAEPRAAPAPPKVTARRAASSVSVDLPSASAGENRGCGRVDSAVSPTTNGYESHRAGGFADARSGRLLSRRCGC